MTLQGMTYLGFPVGPCCSSLPTALSGGTAATARRRLLVQRRQRGRRAAAAVAAGPYGGYQRLIADGGPARAAACAAARTRPGAWPWAVAGPCTCTSLSTRLTLGLWLIRGHHPSLPLLLPPLLLPTAVVHRITTLSQVPLLLHAWHLSVHRCRPRTCGASSSYRSSSSSPCLLGRVLTPPCPGRHRQPAGRPRTRRPPGCISSRQDSRGRARGPTAAVSRVGLRARLWCPRPLGSRRACSPWSRRSRALPARKEHHGWWGHCPTAAAAAPNKVIIVVLLVAVAIVVSVLICCSNKAMRCLCVLDLTFAAPWKSARRLCLALHMDMGRRCHAGRHGASTSTISTSGCGSCRKGRNTFRMGHAPGGSGSWCTAQPRSINFAPRGAFARSLLHVLGTATAAAATRQQGCVQACACTPCVLPSRPHGPNRRPAAPRSRCLQPHRGAAGDTGTRPCCRPIGGSSAAGLQRTFGKSARCTRWPGTGPACIQLMGSGAILVWISRDGVCGLGCSLGKVACGWPCAPEQAEDRPALDTWLLCSALVLFFTSFLVIIAFSISVSAVPKWLRTAGCGGHGKCRLLLAGARG